MNCGAYIRYLYGASAQTGGAILFPGNAVAMPLRLEAPSVRLASGPGTRPTASGPSDLC